MPYLFTALAMASASPVAAVQTADPLPSPEAARKAVVTCGLPARRVTVRFLRFMQEDVVWIGAAGGKLSEDMLTCIARASLKIGYYVYFRDQATQRQYDPLYWRMMEADSIARAREWLSARNLLATLPLPQQGQALADYARAVEEFCGVEKGNFLVALNGHDVTFAKDALGKVTANGVEGAAASEQQFECVMNATTAADLHAHGVFFGFIGNAASFEMPATPPKAP